MSNEIGVALVTLVGVVVGYVASPISQWLLDRRKAGQERDRERGARRRERLEALLESMVALLEAVDGLRVSTRLTGPADAVRESLAPIAKTRALAASVGGSEVRAAVNSFVELAERLMWDESPKREQFRQLLEIHRGAVDQVAAALNVLG